MHCVGVSRDLGGFDLMDQAMMFCDLRRRHVPFFSNQLRLGPFH
jgi:hypothetical protein